MTLRSERLRRHFELLPTESPGPTQGGGLATPTGEVSPELASQAVSKGRAAVEIGSSMLFPLAGRAVGVGRIAGTPLKAALRTSIDAALAGTGGAAGSAASETFDPSQDPGMRALGAGARGAAGELVGQGVFAGGSRLVRQIPGLEEGVAAKMKQSPFFRRIVQPINPSSLEKGALRAIEEARRRGEKITIGQALDAPLLDEFEGLVEASVFGGPFLQRGKTRAVGTVDDAILEVTDAARRAYADDPVKAGKVFQAALEGGRRLHSRFMRGRYRAFNSKVAEEIGDEAIVDIRVLKGLARQRKQEIGRTFKATPEKSPFENTLDEILALPDDVSFAEAGLRRTSLREIADTDTGPMKTRFKGFASLAQKVLTRAERESLRRVSPALKAEWQEVNSLNAAGHERFNNQVVRNLLDLSEPEVVHSALVVPGKFSKLAELKSVVEQQVARGRAPEDAWLRIQGQGYEELLDQATSPASGELSGEALINLIGSKKNTRTYNVLFGPEEMANFLELAQARRVAEKAAGTGQFGAVAMRLQQFNALNKGVQVGLAATTLGGGVAADQPAIGAAGAATILFAPIGLAFLFRSRALVNLLTTGMKAPPGSLQASRAFGQLVARLDQMDLPPGAVMVSAGADKLAQDVGAVQRRSVDIDANELLRQSRSSRP